MKSPYSSKIDTFTSVAESSISIKKISVRKGSNLVEALVVNK